MSSPYCVGVIHCPGCRSARESAAQERRRIRRQILRLHKEMERRLGTYWAGVRKALDAATRKGAGRKKR